MRVGVDRDSKMILSFEVGDRSGATAIEFMDDLRAPVGKPCRNIFRESFAQKAQLLIGGEVRERHHGNRRLGLRDLTSRVDRSLRDFMRFTSWRRHADNVPSIRCSSWSAHFHFHRRNFGMKRNSAMQTKRSLLSFG